MKKFVSSTMVVCSTITILMLTPKVSLAECTLSHEECHNVYTCTEYYPNGTDCRKTEKTQECHTVCDQFDVDRGGIDDANRNVSPPSETDSEAASSEEK